MTPCPRCIKGSVLTDGYGERVCAACARRPDPWSYSPVPPENRRYNGAMLGALPKHHVRRAPVTDFKRG